VTCGDIGTNPEAIEKYLETVLYIGELWGCVVLLDEADVFLEERSLADLERAYPAIIANPCPAYLMKLGNAMVSVFLRVLEYYEGILVLTSNRVGTFDEAFKSRIQLALHYPNLSEADRRKIWGNFIKTLDEVEENVDLADLEDRVDDLARHKMNGRQIRNAVTTARQLAQYRKQTLDYGHFEHVISTMVEFDQYLEKTHRHTDDQWAREEGVRY
jgi:SpoVK/Ycf46/Vps4 family AAA+-type ATPase